MNDEEIFKQGSTTYYWSSKFFPKGVRDDVFKLYSFVRVVDDYVDSPEPNIERFNYIRKQWTKLKKDLNNTKHLVVDGVDDRVLRNVAYVVHRYDCDTAWIDAFLDSMQMDIEGRSYDTIDETLEYIYGSAEVIGLLMAKILGLPEKSYEYARLQGRAMQYINFIRDIAEDQELGRQYFPQEDLITHGLKDVSEREATRKPSEFREFIVAQIRRHDAWQKEASKGFRYIPRRYRIAIRTAVDMYAWTGRVLADNPQIIFQRKVKPSKARVLRAGLRRGVHA
jgi:15-cis-phytoene synthase